MLVTGDPSDPTRLVSQVNGAGLRLMARLCAGALDRQLAAGTAPESTRLLACRADRLAAPRMRRRVADGWLGLLQLAHGPARACGPHSHLRRDRIVGAETEVRAMLSALTAPRPTSARGVAMATCLLVDGSGPLYHRQCGEDLRAALRRVTVQLDAVVPWAEGV